MERAYKHAFPSLQSGPLAPSTANVDAFKRWYRRAQRVVEHSGSRATSPLSRVFKGLQVLRFDSAWQEKGFIHALDAAKIPMGFHCPASLEAFPMSIKALLNTLGISEKRPFLFVPAHHGDADAALKLAVYHVWRFWYAEESLPAYATAANLFLHRHLKKKKALTPKMLEGLNEFEKTSLYAYLQEDMDALMVICS